MAGPANHQGRRGNSWLTAAWITVTALILLAPLIGMQFSDEVNWTVSDFALAGGVLVGCGIIYELAARAGNLAYRAGVVLALAASVLALWITGAVGIIGSEHNPGNLLYLAIVAFVIIGAMVTRGRAAGLAWVMTAAAIAEILLPAIAFAGAANPRNDVLAPEVFIATAVFTGMWLLSAWLFRKSARAG